LPLLQTGDHRRWTWSKRKKRLPAAAALMKNKEGSFKKCFQKRRKTVWKSTVRQTNCNLQMKNRHCQADRVGIKGDGASKGRTDPV